MLGVLIGFVLGLLLTGIAIFVLAPRMMLMEDRSNLGFQETVDTIEKIALEADWQVPSIHPVSNSVAKAGYSVRPATVVELCHPVLAGQILGSNEGRKVVPLMPCRVAVYENEDGSVTISRMNSVLMSKLFGGIVHKVMSKAAGENEEMFKPLLKK